MICAEFKGYVAPEGLYLNVPASTSHVVFMEKTKLRNLGKPHVSVLEKGRIFKLESPLRLPLPSHWFLEMGKLKFEKTHPSTVASSGPASRPPDRPGARPLSAEREPGLQGGCPHVLETLPLSRGSQGQPGSQGQRTDLQDSRLHATAGKAVS